MLCFITCKDSLLLQKEGEGWRVPYDKEIQLPQHGRRQPLPAINGEDCIGYAMSSPTTFGTDQAWFPLRQTHSILLDEQYRIAGKAAMLSYFDQTTHYCGMCGAPMVWHSDISKRCSECGKEIWPQVAAAIIVRVERNDEILLVRSHNFRGDFYGLVAGFVETGETLEDCVRREVLEETGLQISDIHYFGSQPWPFPCGLMIGFTAKYAGGEVRLQHAELSSGGWFRRDNLPTIPDRASIARQLIDDFYFNE